MWMIMSQAKKTAGNSKAKRTVRAERLLDKIAALRVRATEEELDALGAEDAQVRDLLRDLLFGTTEE